MGAGFSLRLKIGFMEQGIQIPKRRRFKAFGLATSVV